MERGSSSAPWAGHDDDDDEDDYEEHDGGNRLLGFMFGNVDGAGDLDVDYLDEDAKERLAALADKLGHSLRDIDLIKSSPGGTDVSEQDYDEKAEDAIDYEDFDEPYDGPEVQGSTEEDFLLPKKAYFSSDAELASLNTKTSVFGEENYDDDDDNEDIVKENMAEKNTLDAPSLPSEDEPFDFNYKQEISPNDDSSYTGTMRAEDTPFELEEFQEEPDNVQDHIDSRSESALPVLCVEDGLVILRFSEIFGVHEPFKKVERKSHRKLSTNKESVKMMNIADIIEEDEEEYLRSSSNNVLITKHHCSTPEDVEETCSDTDEPIRDSCLCSQPMKADLFLDMHADGRTLLCPDFYPFEQQDWEDEIIWGNSPKVSPSLESRALFEVDGDSHMKAESDEEFEQKNVESGENGFSFVGESIVVESLGSREPQVLTNLHSSERIYHPQLLRLESLPNMDDVCSVGMRTGNGNADVCKGDWLRRFSKLTLQNNDLLEGSWVDQIIWDSDGAIPKPKLILDLQDEHMLFEILDHKDAEHIRSHAGAMVITCSPKQETFDSCGQMITSAGPFNISNDPYDLNRKSSQQAKSHAKKRASLRTKVMHSVPALKLQTMKPRLSNKDVANFHRPKALWYPHENLAAANLQGTLHTSGLMKIILMSIGGKAIKLNISADETLSSLKTKASKKLDFKSSEKVKIFYSGKELDDDKSLSKENVLPNSVLHLVRTRIHVWPRAQKLPGENKPLRPPGAFKKKSELSVKDGHVFLMEYCEERPLFLGNVGMGARLCTYYQKTAPGGQTASIPRNGNDGLGSVIALDPADKSPFLGDISLSSSQSCIETNMYRAPIFSHKCSSTDYLLVRSAKGMLSLRRIDKVYVVGQQEPHMEVLSPGTKYVQLYLADRLMAYLYREFRAKEKPNLLPSIRVDELAAQFPSLTDAFIRKRVKQCAELRKGPKGHWVWVKRRDFRTPTEEELRRILTPESVCSYESMLAGLHRLKSLGISKLTHPVGLSSAMNQLPDEAITLAAASHIERELQITSWNLTSNFVACISQGRDNIERLEITGVGDPSGRGLGFSYVRATPKAPISSVAVKKKASAARGSSAVTGTDADLRRLSMDAAREVLLKFNVPEVQIDKLTRWHRIAMVRKLSSEQAASGVKVDAVTLNKFARGQRMSFLQLQQQSREKCQEIWDRQVQSLSAADGDENDSDCEANSDLDSFAGDLENLLDAEECEEDDGSTPLKADNVDGVRGIKMRRCPSHAQTEAEIEDDEAEAFLIRRLLEDNADDLKKKKPIFTDVNNGYQSGTEYIGSAKKPNSIIRPFSSMIHADGSFTSKDVIMQEPIEVEKSLAERNVTWKVSAKKGNGKEENTPVGMLKMKSGSLKDRPKFFKEKKPMDKPVREGFACGACGQSGHMRTNKNCPKYGEDMLSEKKLGEDAETTDLGSVSTKSHLPDVVGQAKLKTPNKKVTPKVLKVADLEVAESVEKTGSLPALQPVKFPSLKFKCGPSEKSLSGTQTPDKQNVPDGEMETQSKRKINRIVFSNMINSEDVPSDMHKPSVVVRLPIDTEKDQRRKKIIIKQPRSMGKLEQVKRPIDTAEDHGFRKIKKIVELSSFERQKKHEDVFHAEETNKRNSTFERSHRNEEKRKSRESIAEDRTMRIVERRPKEEHRSLRGIRMQGAIREEEPPKEKKKKKKKKKHDFSDEHLLDRRAYRNDRRISERDRAAKRRAINDLEQAENTHFTKRRRGGEVVLSNILEAIVDELMKTYADVSYLFHKPVNKKEAPDYYDVIKNPMDLSTIRDRVRNLVYKSREEFRHDIWQITYNAHSYNDGRNPGIPPLADQLLELCDYLIQDKGEMLTDAEADIKVQV